MTNIILLFPVLWSLCGLYCICCCVCVCACMHCCTRAGGFEGVGDSRCVHESVKDSPGAVAPVFVSAVSDCWPEPPTAPPSSAVSATRPQRALRDCKPPQITASGWELLSTDTHALSLRPRLHVYVTCGMFSTQVSNEICINAAMDS